MTSDDLITDNDALKRQNNELKKELRRYRYSLWSLQNILDPDQRDIIQRDLIDIKIDGQNAQP